MRAPRAPAARIPLGVAAAGILVAATWRAAVPAHDADATLPNATAAADSAAAPYAVVLGIAQDGGVPQAGDRDPAHWDPQARRHVVCLGLVDPQSSQRWMIEATPDFPEQLHALDQMAPRPDVPGLDGIFLTHAHVGHYTGLFHLGLEVLGAHAVPVYAMPRMQEFLRRNGPWEMLVRRRHIELRALADGVSVQLDSRLTLVPLRVPHRQEYSEVVAFRITGPRRSLLFLPDIDRWEDLDAAGAHIEAWIAAVDVAYLDGTFYADGEVPGRDMSAFPHPRILRSMARFAALPARERAKIHFIHLNHTNAALDPAADERRNIETLGFHVAEEMERVDL